MQLFETLLNGLLLGGLYGLIGLGLSINFGTMRVVHLAHGDLIVLAAYFLVLVLVPAGIPPLAAAALVAPVLFVLGWALQRFVVGKSLGRGVLPPLIAASFWAEAAEAPALPVAVGLLICWYIPEIILARAARWPLSARSVLAWLIRDMTAPILWVAGWAGRQIVWRDPARAWQEYGFGGDPNKDSVALKARNRVAILETGGGSLAFFPPSHKFFFAREIEKCGRITTGHA